MLKALTVGLVAVLGLGGCKEATGPVATRFLGTYNLESFDDNVLPYLSSVEGGVRVEVLNGSITLDSAYGFEMSRSWRITYPDSVRNQSSGLNGRYAVSGNQIAFYGDERESFGGVVTDTMLTIIEEGTLINFRRSGR